MHKTVISQYANSPTILALIDAMDASIDPGPNFDAFYDYVWNVLTARGFGLDIWGRIVNVGRNLNIPGTQDNFGFSGVVTGSPIGAMLDQNGNFLSNQNSQHLSGGGALSYQASGQPFDQAPFYTGPAASSVFRLGDDPYRQLILAKALANISDCTVPSLNRVLQLLFPGRGRAFVTDTGAMEMRYVFEFPLLPYELAIITQSGVMARPAAVSARVQIMDAPSTFGFAETGTLQPFGQGVFFSTSGLIDATQ